MSAGVVREVQFNDGQGLLFGDLNDAQRFARALVLDLLTGSRANLGGLEIGPSVSNLYALGAGGSAAIDGSDLTVTNRAGTILQLPSGAAAVDGADARVLAYYVAADELRTTIAAPHATLDRIDLVCVKLNQAPSTPTTRDFEDATTHALSSQTFDIRRDVQLTVQYVVGTPNATPAPPAVPAGFVAWSRLYVVANMVGPFNLSTHITDMRYPIGGLSTMVQAGCQLMFKAADWAPQTDGSVIASAAGKVLYALCPAHAAARALSVYVAKTLTVGGGGAIALVRRDMVTLSDASLAADLVPTTGAVNESFDLTVDSIHAGPGMWAAGFRAPVATGGVRALALKITSGANTDKVNAVQWTAIG